MTTEHKFKKFMRIRGRPQHRSRSRKRALPLTSLLFVISVLALASYYIQFPPSVPDQTPSHHSNPSLPYNPKAPFLQTVSRMGDYGNLCSRKGNVFSKKWSLSFLVPGVIFCFVGLAIITDDYFVAALEQICQQLDLTEDVAGATFMAAGSSTPEFFASMIGVFLTKDSVGMGTIVGSAVFNILVIIGLSAALAGAALRLDWRPLLRDSVFYVISIILLFIFTILFPNDEGVIYWWEGFILVCTYGIYVLFMAYGNKPYMKWAASLGLFGITSDHDVELGVPASAVTNVQLAQQSDVPEEEPPMTQPSLASAQTYRSIGVTPDGKPRYRDLRPRTRLKAAQLAVIATQRLASPSISDKSADDVEDDTNVTTSPETRTEDDNDDDEDMGKSFLGVELPKSKLGWVFFPMTFIWRLAFSVTVLDCAKPKYQKLWIVTFLTAVLWISGISYVMVEAARISGCLIGIPSAVMGLTVLAAGTSVPDALASISVARDGAGDMAVSNAIGSNVFDILLGLGFPWMVGNWALGSGSIVIETSPITEVVVPIIILFVIMVLFVGILIAFKWTMRPLFGYILFGLYFVFVTYTLVDSLVISKD